MALTRRVLDKDEEEEAARRISEFESQGSKKYDPSARDKKKEKAYCFRLPVDLIKRIDAKCRQEVERMPRNTWVVIALDAAASRKE